MPQAILLNNDPLANAGREVMWNVSALPNSVLMYTFFAISVVIFSWGIIRRIELWSAGKSDRNRFHNLGERLLLAWHYIAGQRSVVAERKPGVFHTLIYLGFLTLLFTTTMVFIDHDLGIKIYNGRFYLAVTILSDFFGLFLILGILLAWHRRYIEKPDRLHLTRQDSLMLTLLLLMCVQGYLLEGLRIIATNDPWKYYSPVGFATSLIFTDISPLASRVMHFGIWWFHAITVFAFIAIIPYTKFFHIISSSANLFFREIERPKGAIPYPGDIETLMEQADTEFSLGISTIADLTWKQRLDLDACTSCGRCQSVCPAYNSGKILSPKWLVLDLRDHMLSLQAEGKDTSPSRSLLPLPLRSALDKLDQLLLKTLLLGERQTGPDVAVDSTRASNPLTQGSVKSLGVDYTQKLAGDILDPDVFWSCTTCRACVEVCPVGIEHVDLITEVRRSMTLMEGSLPTEAQGSLRAIETRGNPFGPAEERALWSDGLELKILQPGDEVDLLYWVGCVSAFDKRKQKIARAMVEILNRSGLSWGTLGNNECCTGDPARRLGEENLFQSLAKRNIATFETVKFKRIVANCPHCFNTISNEYPQVNGKQIPVIHHTQLIKELVDEGKLHLPGETKRNFTFHDPCYLGRHNGTYEEPREVLVQISGKRSEEMRDSRERGLCCGAGGGHFWMDLKVGERINVQRVKQAMETSADTIATGCPFCLQMMEDGVKLTESEQRFEVKDIAELVVEALG